VVIAGGLAFVAVADLDASTARPTRSHRREVTWKFPALFGATVLAELAVRIMVTISRHGPYLMADELGYLSNGRLIAGGAHTDMTQTTFYYGGYGLFLAPAFLVTHDPALTYHLALLIGAVLSTLTMPLLYGLLRDLGLAREVALVAAAVAAITPDTIFSVSLTMSENLLTPLLVAWIWTAVHLLKHESLGRNGYYWAAAQALCLGLLVATHPRGLVIAAAGIVLLVIAIRWIGWRLAAVAIVAGLILMAAAVRFNIWLMRTDWPGYPTGQLIPGSGSKSTPGESGGIGRALSFTSGQLWYATVASACLVPLGFLFILMHTRRETGRARIASAAAAIFAIVALGATTAGPATLMASTAHNQLLASHFVYGRYVAVVIPIFAAWGVASLLETRAWWRRTAWLPTVAILGILTFWTYTFADSRLLKLPVNTITVPTILAIVRPFISVGHAAQIHLPRTTAIALVVFIVVAALSAFRLRWLAAIAAAAVFLTWSGTSFVTNIHRADSRTFPGGHTGMQISAVTHAKHLAWDLQIAPTVNIQWKLRYTFYAEDGPLTKFNSSVSAPPANSDVVVAAATWDGTALGFVRVTQTPSIPGVVWKRS
jgi:hypothetical protein